MDLLPSVARTSDSTSAVAARHLATFVGHDSPYVLHAMLILIGLGVLSERRKLLIAGFTLAARPSPASATPWPAPTRGTTRAPRANTAMFPKPANQLPSDPGGKVENMRSLWQPGMGPGFGAEISQTA